MSRNDPRLDGGLARLALALVPPTLLIALAARGWAQAPAEPTGPAVPDRPEDVVAILLIAAAGLLLVVGLVGKMLELRSRRDGETIAVRGVMSDVLGREPSLLGLTITKVRVPLWTGSPVTIRIAGDVASRQHRRDALRSLERAAKSELVVAVRIRSRIKISPIRSPASDLRTARSG